MVFLRRGYLYLKEVHSLVTCIKFYNEEMWKAAAAFNDSTDLLNFSESNAADAKTVREYLINLISS